MIFGIILTRVDYEMGCFRDPESRSRGFRIRFSNFRPDRKIPKIPKLGEWDRDLKILGNSKCKILKIKGIGIRIWKWEIDFRLRECTGGRCLWSRTLVMVPQGAFNVRWLWTGRVDKTPVVKYIKSLRRNFKFSKIILKDYLYIRSFDVVRYLTT